MPEILVRNLDRQLIERLKERADQNGRSLQAEVKTILERSVETPTVEEFRMTHISKDMPPYLLIHGTKDDLVPYDQSVVMCERMKQAGASCEIFTVEGGAHGVGNWERDPVFQAYKRKMVDWLHKTLRY